MSFKNFKVKLDSLLGTERVTKPKRARPVKKKPVDSSATFKRFVAESSYSQRNIHTETTT